jgi:hypothetical protein
VVVLLKPQQLLLQETLRYKYIGFGIGSKKTVACIIQKTAPFSRENSYNQATTRKPLISQFSKNSLLVSALTTVTYKKVEIWQRIQWTFPNK